MKIGRNDLCPCGSGKKYKKCCMNKGLVVEKEELDDFDEFEEFTEDEHEFYFNMLRNMHELCLKYKEHIKLYYKARKLHGEIINSMISYHESGKYDFNGELEKVSEDIFKELEGNIDKFNLRFSTNSQRETLLFYNLLIYKNHPKMVSITEEYLNKNKFRNEEKKALLKAMNESYVSLFKKVKIDKDNGYVYLEDIFTKKQFKVIDISGSLGLDPEDSYTYHRIITYNGISFTSGLALSFFSNNKEINDYIKKYSKKKTSEFVRFLNLYDIYKRNGIPVRISNIK